MRPEEIQITGNKQEEIFEMKAEYPYIMRQIYTRAGKTLVAPWHWHEELELVLVRYGVVNYETPQGNARIAEGSGAFVNSNILHRVALAIPTEECMYEVHMFRRNFLAEPGSLLDQKYIRPFLQNRAHSFFQLDKGVNAHKKILDRLSGLSACEVEKSSGYEMRARNLMSELWLDLSDLVKEDTEVEALYSVSKEMRLKEMLLYMQEFYGDSISLKEIANAAHISERECLRSFQEGLGVTPFTYLQEYRIQAACSLLKNTSDKIVEIAGKCGFRSSSYFGKVFQRQMHCTPREYRRR